jgi:hypothetical protein
MLQYYAVHRSQPYSLVAGQGYYIEGLHKEGTGGTSSVLKPGWPRNRYRPAALQPAAKPVDPGAWMGYPAAPPGIGGPLEITQQPASQSVNANSSATFNVVATNPMACPSYQWQRDSGTGFEDIAGANNASTIALAALTDSGRNSAPGFASSARTHLVARPR